MSTKSFYEVELTNNKFTEAEFSDIDIEKDDDETLAKKIDQRLSEGSKLHKEKSDRAKDSMNLFRGKIGDIADAKANKFKSKTVLSRLFFTIRNMVGLATDSPANVEIVPDNDNVKSIRRAKNIQSNIDWQMLNSNFYDKLSMALIDAWVKSDCFFMWFWNYEKDDIDCEAVMLEDLTLSAEAKDVQSAEFIVYHPLKGRSWWKKNWPDHYENIEFVTQDAVGIEEKQSTSVRGNAARLIQYWENDILVEKVRSKEEGKDIILRKVKNPTFEYRDETTQLKDMANKINPNYMLELKAAGIDNPGDEEIKSIIPELEQFVPIKNFFTQGARKPFVQLPSMKLLGELYSEEITQQAREVYLSMNEKKRAFDDNLRGCNQKIVVDSDSLSKKEADKITDEPNQVIRVSFGDNKQPLYIAKGGEVPTSFHADIQHDEMYIDDLYGSHEISRGAGKSNTLGQDQMNFESDRTPIRFQTRNTERTIVEIVEGWLQLMRLFYTDTHYAKKFGRKEGIELIEIINEDIEQGVSPHIKPGSMVTLTRNERIQRALQLWSGGAIDPYTFYVEMDMPNPSELADRLVNWQMNGIVSPEDPDQVTADKIATDPALQSVEKADQENMAIQAGENIPPTPPEYVSVEHVKMHYAFLNDKTKKLEDPDMDILQAHADTDKATLVTLMQQQEKKRTTEEGAQVDKGQEAVAQK